MTPSRAARRAANRAAHATRRAEELAAWADAAAARRAANRAAHAASRTARVERAGEPEAAIPEALSARRPVSLIPFLSSIGGLKPCPDLAHMGVGGKGRLFGALLRANGKALDVAANDVAEAGYLPADPYASDLLDAIADELAGFPSYSTRDTGDVAAWREAEMHNAARERAIETGCPF